MARQGPLEFGGWLLGGCWLLVVGWLLQETTAMAMHATKIAAQNLATNPRVTQSHAHANYDMGPALYSASCRVLFARLFRPETFSKMKLLRICKTRAQLKCFNDSTTQCFATSELQSGVLGLTLRICLAPSTNGLALSA